MPNTLRIKRRATGGGAGAPSGLANAELAYNEQTNILYYGWGTGGAGGTATQVIPIAGSGSYTFVDGSNANGTWPISINGNSATVTNGVYTSRSISAGDGLSGGGDLSANRTLSVDSSVVRTTGNQTINGAKTFNSRPTFNSGIIISQNGNNLPPLISAGANGDSHFMLTSPTASSTGVLLFGVNVNADAAPFRIMLDSNNTDAYITNGTWRASTISVDKGGTGQTSYSNGQLLIGSGGSLAPNTLSAGTGIAITNGSGSITINTNAVSTNTASTIVSRDSSGNFSVGNITATGFIRSGGTSSQFLKADGSVDSAVYAATNQTMFIGTTSVAINRSSASLALSGVSIDGNAGSVTNGVYTSGSYADPSWITSLAKSKVGLANVTNDAQIKKLASSTNGNIPIWNGTTGDALSDGYSVETSSLVGGATAIPRADVVKNYVDAQITAGFNANDAMQFKGTLGTGGTVTALPSTTVSAGWTYRVITAGTYAGVVCEVGDLIIAVADAAGNVNSTWTVVQTNIDGAVVGPVSSTSGALAVFNGTTGKLIQNSSFVPTTVGGNLINLTNPGAITFIKVNADNSVSTESNSAYRTSLGATTVGSNLFTLTNPSAISFLRVNADNTVTARSAANFLTDIGVNDATLTLNVSGSGLSGSQTFTANQSTGATFTVTSNATAANTASAIVIRDSSGNFSAGTITASLNGNASTVTSGVYTSGSYADPSWITSLAKSKVGLGNVENTALSTWAGSTSLTTLGTIGTGTWNATTIAVNRGGTGQTSYINGELLIGNTTGNTLTKATLTAGTGISITNGAGSITVAHSDTSPLSAGAVGASGISSITIDDFGHIQSVTSTTYLTQGTLCAAFDAAACVIDGGTF